MDILRKELTAIYTSQQLGNEILDNREIIRCCAAARNFTQTAGGCAVITDADADRCYIYGACFAGLLGIDCDKSKIGEFASSDEDIIYTRLHPHDLPDKRLLEYEYFRTIDHLSADYKMAIHAACRIRIMDGNGKYVWFDNTTRVICPSPNGKIWLILCTYNISPNQTDDDSISPTLVNDTTGDVKQLVLSSQRNNILTPREKEVLKLIKSGKLSKEIADELGISINTVNRHRQNILDKLSVDNSMEAVMAATAMHLL